MLQENAEHDRVLTVVEVLERGSPLVELAPTYLTIVLDHHKPLWLRERSLNLSLSLHNESVYAGYKYFRALAGQDISTDRVRLQLNLAVKLMEKLRTSEIKSLLSDYASLKTSEYVGLLMPLGKVLRQSVPPGLFDTSVNTWLPELRGYTRRDEVDRELEAILASLIRDGDEQTAEQIWLWTQNIRQHAYGSSGDNVVAAIAQRYGHTPSGARLLEAAYRIGPISQELVHHDIHAYGNC